MAIASYGAHTCPDDGHNLRPCSYTHDMYECPACTRFWVGETINSGNGYEVSSKNGQGNRHFNG